MIVMTIINGNMYVAGLAFVWFPSVLLLFTSLLVKRTSIFTTQNFIIFLIGLSAWYSTYNSDVVDKDNGGLVNLLFSLLAFVYISTVKYDDKMIGKIFRFYKLFAFTICCIMCINFVIRYGISVNGRVSIRYFGITKDVNYLTAFLVPAYALYFYSTVIGRQKKHLVNCFIMLVAFFLSGSRSVFIAAILSSVLIFVKYMFSKQVSIQSRVAIILAISAFVIVFYLLLENNPLFSRMTTTENYDDNVRFKIWDYAMLAFYKNPVWGSGVRSGSYYSSMETNWVTHNSWLDVLTGQGIVGSFIVILLVISLFVRVSKEHIILVLAFFVACFLPLFFVNGYECATFWMPMLLCKILSDKCRTKTNIIELIS